MQFYVCSLCSSAVNFAPDIAQIAESSLQCALCFGLLQNAALHQQIVQKTVEELRKNAYDSRTFLLALNTPITMHFREILMEKILGDAWVPVLMSPKGQLSMLLMTKIAEATGLRPTLNSNLILTITLLHDEFVKNDIEFLVLNFAKELLKRGKKRRNEPDDVSAYYTKVKINEIANVMTKESAQRYKMLFPTREFDLSVIFERESIFVAGRYLKFSRTLPQSPWTSVPYAPKLPLNSVSEKIGETLKKHFCADNYRFVSCGREDIDVRMLGNGRPFAVEILNARKIESLGRFTIAKTLNLLEDKVNRENPDIKVTNFYKVTSKQVLTLNVGAEEKRKVYSALCYSKVALTDEMVDKLSNVSPLEISQKTVIRVLKRRPLIDRKRTIFAMSAFRLDDYHLLVNFETQAGTYVKELVHGDFGRTRPSLGLLMGLQMDDVDILELDVEGVDFEWPPTASNIHAERCSKHLTVDNSINIIT